MLISNTRGAAECGEVHLVSEVGLSGILYIQSWRDQARRFMQLAKQGTVLDLTHLTIKAIGDKRQWQCTDFDVYGQIMGEHSFEKQTTIASAPPRCTQFCCAPCPTSTRSRT